MTQYPKRLIEVDLPIKRISTHARREKSIRHGHISTLHIWWARRPLAACRVVICASLWPAPTDPTCPDVFLRVARSEMLKWTEFERLQLLGSESQVRFQEARKNPTLLDDPAHLQQALLDFIADFANWDNSTNKHYLETSRTLTQAAHEALGGLPGTRPLVVDPFAGGGSIPLEALRVGADAFASDLNPVAVLLNKVVLEYIPKYGQRLADEVRKWGEWIKQEAEKELAEFYPKDPDGATPIAYLWARTIRCEGPGCGAEVPMMRSFWLAKKGKKSIGLRLIPSAKDKCCYFEVVHEAQGKLFDTGTVQRGSATCPCCGYTTSVDRVRIQLKTRMGGAQDACLVAVVTINPGKQGRNFRLPIESDFNALRKAHMELQRRINLHQGEISLIPEEVLPVMSGVFNAPLYGMNTWGSLFSSRQLLALTTLSKFVVEVGTQVRLTEDIGLANAIQVCLAMALDKQADSNSSLCAWRPTSQDIGHTFGRQALPMLWDFVEANIFSGATRDWLNAVEGNLKALTSLDRDISAGEAAFASATSHPLPDDSVQTIITDPPYYNAVPYADLSDFFYVWLMRTIGNIYPELFSTELVSKDDEICEMAGWDSTRYPHKDGRWFESKMGQALSEARRILEPSGVGTVVFAHKSTSGWEALLQAMIDAGWIITGSWPIDTEMGSRLRAANSAALASSVHIVCRPRENSDGSVHTYEIGDWRDILQELPTRIHLWLPRLAAEGVVGADAIFACLGPALEIFSRYSRVEKANGDPVALGEYLEVVWGAVSKEALAMVFAGADTSGFEEDARLTAMWLWTLSAGEQSDKAAEGQGEEEASDEDGEQGGKGAGEKGKGGYVLEYDAARKIAQGLGAHLEQLTSLIQVKGSEARLLPVRERSKFLFGKAEVNEPAPRGRKPKQPTLFESLPDAKEAGWEFTPDDDFQVGNSTLDRVHQSMLLFQSGRSDTLKRFLVDQGIGQNERFWRLAQAFSALYPSGSDEKRWVDGVLARKKGLGL